jgi:hypothetical protein
LTSQPAALKRSSAPGVVAKLDPDLLQQGVGVALDQRETLFAEYLGRRDRAGYVGD